MSIKSIDLIEPTLLRCLALDALGVEARCLWSRSGPHTKFPDPRLNTVVITT